MRWQYWVLIAIFSSANIARAEVNQEREWKLNEGTKFKWQIEKLRSSSLYIGITNLEEGDTIELEILGFEDREDPRFRYEVVLCNVKIGANEPVREDVDELWIFPVFNHEYYEREAEEINKDENRRAELSGDILTIHEYFENPWETIESTTRLNIAKGYLIYYHHHNKEEFRDIETEVRKIDDEGASDNLWGLSVLSTDLNDLITVISLGLVAFGIGIGVAQLLRRRQRSK
ncbi:MAG: hypothetical protein ACXAEI_14755 [Candidatus Hodarchaeales archaeon]